MKFFLLIPLLVCFPVFFYAQTTSTFSVAGSQTFVSPAGITAINVQAWGAGGAGGSSTNPGSSGARGGSGGGGGAFASAPLTITSGASLTVVVGAGGKGIAGADGNFGGFSAITGFAIKVDGGKGGLVNTGNNPVGGLGGASAASIGTVTTSGAPGLAGESGFIDGTGASISSGAGGNAANGGGTGGIAITGFFVTSVGNAGNAPGGGGSGGRSSFFAPSQKGGDGGDGKIIISYNCPTYSLFSTDASAVNVCSGSSSEVTLTGNLPIGLYKVSYDIQGVAQTPATMNVTTAGTGTFIASGFTTVGFKFIKITGLTSGSSTVASENCTSAINVNNLATVTVNSSGTAPVALAGTGATCTQITANWQAVSGATYYELDVSTDNTFATFVTGYSARNVGNVLTYNVTGLVNNTYYYRVRAYNGTCISADSNVITYATTVAPGVPNATAGSGKTCSQITANWTAVTGATSYFLDVSTQTGANFNANMLVGYNNLNVGNVLSKDVTGLSVNTTYYYRVRATNSCATSASSAIITYSTSTNTAAGVPATPTASAGTGQTCSQFTANWAAAARASSYIIDVSTQTGGAFTANILPAYNGLNVGNVLSFDVTGLNANTTYYYRVRATNTCGTSTNSSVITYGTTTGGAGTPTVPTANPGTGQTCTQFAANWASATRATSYIIDVSSQPGGAFNGNILPAYNGLNVGNVLIKNITGLSANTTYYYRVRATNNCGTSVSSSVISASTTSVPAVPVISPTSSAICQTDGVTLAVNSPNALYTYVWSTGETGTSIFATAAGSYTVKAVNSGGCTSANSVASVVTVDGLPTATAGGSRTVCSNQSVTVTGASATNGTIKWTFSGGAGTLTNDTTLTPTYTPTLGGAARTVILTMTVTSTNTCSPQIATATYTINIQGAPTASISGSQSTCSNGSITLAAGEANASNGTILWTHDGAGSISAGATTLTPTYTAAAADAGKQVTLTMTVTASPSCATPYTVTDIYPVIVRAENTTTAASSSPVLCINATMTNITHTTTGATGIGAAVNLPTGVSASWASNTITISGTPTQSGTFNYSIPLTGGCGVVSATGTIVVKTLSSTPILGTIVQPTCITPTGSIVLNGLLSTPTWLITQNGTVSTTYGGSGNTYTIPNLAPGTYTFTIEDGVNCRSLPTVSIEIKAPITNIWDGMVWSKGSAPTSTSTESIEFAADYQSVGDLKGCSCKVDAGKKVTINSGHTLILDNGLIVDAGAGTSLTFEDSASLYQLNSVINTGNIIYKRNTTPVRRYDFTYWSTPITNSITPYTLHDLSPNTLFDKYASYNPQTGSWVYSINGTQVMVPAVGYWVRAPQPYSTTIAAIYTATFTGVPNNGDYSVQVYDTKWSLIGNPYPSAIDGEKFILINQAASVNVGALYFWTHNSPPAATGTGTYAYTSNDFAVFSLTGGTSTGAKLPDGTYGPPPTGMIASCQGFFMQGSGTQLVKFTNDMRIGGSNNQFYKTAQVKAIEKNRIWLDLTNTQGAFKQILVGYIEGATNGWDINYDAQTMNANSFIDFYSINDATKLTVQGRALPFQDTDRVPLGYKTTVAGNFTIAINHVDGLFNNNQAIYLEDKVTGIVQDLRAGNYTFTTAIGTFTDRFTISYTKKTLGTGDFVENIDNNVFVSVKDKNIKVTSTIEALEEVVIYDISGKMLYDKKKIGNIELQMLDLQLSNQVLLVKVILDNGYSTSRKIVF
ncbi:T9SS sorting signal type C domain-containing protein [uncultured Flavobacterium sp.]|uniref:T9SS sorting signal type C domain-containing protein n=1 Tax=uncultured Flavobacterium sp. TaxID=165435 RepID=UPI002930FF93|nr:T9SS sorting signal type C domain-containing protein [uncultured Flavobacterium sp.]